MIRAYKSGGTLYDTLICCKNRFKMVCWFSLVSQPGQTVLSYLALEGFLWHFGSIYYTFIAVTLFDDDRNFIFGRTII